MLPWPSSIRYSFHLYYWVCEEGYLELYTVCSIPVGMCYIEGGVHRVSADHRIIDRYGMCVNEMVELERAEHVMVAIYVAGLYLKFCVIHVGHWFLIITFLQGSYTISVSCCWSTSSHQHW